MLRSACGIDVEMNGSPRDGQANCKSSDEARAENNDSFGEWVVQWGCPTKRTPRVAPQPAVDACARNGLLTIDGVWRSLPLVPRT